MTQLQSEQKAAQRGKVGGWVREWGEGLHPINNRKVIRELLLSKFADESIVVQVERGVTFDVTLAVSETSHSAHPRRGGASSGTRQSSVHVHTHTHPHLA